MDSREIANIVIDKFEELLNQYDIKLPSSDREENNDEAAIFGSDYYELEDTISNILTAYLKKDKEIQDDKGNLSVISADYVGNYNDTTVYDVVFSLNGEKDHATLEKRYNDKEASYTWEVSSYLGLKDEEISYIIQVVSEDPPIMSSDAPPRKYEIDIEEDVNKINNSSVNDVNDKSDIFEKITSLRESFLYKGIADYVLTQLENEKEDGREIEFGIEDVKEITEEVVNDDYFLNSMITNINYAIDRKYTTQELKKGEEGIEV